MNTAHHNPAPGADLGASEAARQPNSEISPQPAAKMRLLRLPLVEERTALKRSTLYRLVKSGDLAAPVRISARCIAWRESDIDDFIAGRVTARSL